LHGGVHGKHSEHCVHCLAENQVMIRLARKAGMSVVTEYGEADAHVALGDGPLSDYTRSERCLARAVIAVKIRSMVAFSVVLNASFSAVFRAMPTTVSRS